MSGTESEPSHVYKRLPNRLTRHKTSLDMQALGSYRMTQPVMMRKQEVDELGKLAAELEHVTKTESRLHSNDPQLGFFGDVAVAFLSVFLGATDGLSAGAVFFPADAKNPNADYRSLGMNIGLLTSMVMNICLALLSQMPHSVGGMILPAVPCMAKFFAYIGPAEPATILFAIPAFTISFGLAVTIASFAIGNVGHMIKYCPFPVFAGFLCGSGLQLMEFAVNMMFSGFKESKDIESWKAIVCKDFLLLAGPGIFAAFFCFFLPRHSRFDWQSVLIGTIVSLALLVYSYILGMGITLAEARQKGLFFEVEFPRTIDCFKLYMMQDLGSVRWDLLCSSSAASAFAQVFVLGFLTICKNLYGVIENTKSHIDVDKEIRAIGLANIFSGLALGGPGSSVMCFSVSAHALGARTKRFSFCVALWSILLFVFGDYVVALLPRAVPAFVLFWLGLLLVVPYAWDLRGKSSFDAYAIIVVTSLLDLMIGCGITLVVGLFLSFVVAIRQMVHTKAIRKSFSLASMHSDVSRSIEDSYILQQQGGSVQVLQLAQGYMAFWTAHHIEEQVFGLLQLTGGSLLFLVLDFTHVTRISTSVLTTLKDLLEVGHEHQFYVMFACIQEDPREQIERFGMHLDDVSNGVSALPQEPAHNSALVVDCLNFALELCEEHLINKSVHMRTRAKEILEHQHGHVLTGNALPTHCSLQDTKEAIIREVEPSTNPLLYPLLVEIHRWLFNFSETYDVASMVKLVGYVEVRSCSAGDIIYAPNEFSDRMHDTKLRPILIMESKVPPPLIWLIDGELEHTWKGPELKGLNAFDGTRLEKLVLRPDALGHFDQCVGPLDTLWGFRGSMAHVGRIAAVKDSRILLLSRPKFSDLMKDFPLVADLLIQYLQRKESMAVTRRSRPKYSKLFQWSTTGMRLGDVLVEAYE